MTKAQRLGIVPLRGKRPMIVSIDRGGEDGDYRVVWGSLIFATRPKDRTGVVQPWWLIHGPFEARDIVRVMTLVNRWEDGEIP